MTNSNEAPREIWERRKDTLTFLMPFEVWHDGFKCGLSSVERLFADDQGDAALCGDKLAWLSLHAGFVLGGLGKLREAEPVGVADVLGQIAELLPETILAEELQRRLAEAVEQQSAQ